MNIDEKIAEYKADIEKCERVCAMTAIGSIRDAAMRKAEDCREMIEWLEDYKRLKIEHETVGIIKDNVKAVFDNTKTIIEADKAESEDKKE